MKEFVEFIVKHLVNDPTQVRVQEFVGERTNIYEIKVAPQDMNFVIGKRGRTVTALRILVNAACKKSGKYAEVEMLEPKK
jgi:predicted RNA-binding protein YlqC (UPF0109 family)